MDASFQFTSESSEAPTPPKLQARHTTQRNSLEALFGLNYPWLLTQHKVCEEFVILEVQVDWRPIPCICNSAIPYRHAWRTRRYRLPPINGRHVIANVGFQTYQCAACGKTQGPQLPSGKYTPDFRKLVGRIGLTSSSVEVSEHFSLDRSTATRMIQEEIDAQLALRRVEAPNILGIDNCELAKSQRTVLIDIKRRMPLDVLDSIKERTVIQGLQIYKEDWSSDLQAVVIDQSESFRRAVLAIFPRVPIILDRFHLAMNINHLFAAFADRYRAQYEQQGCKRLPPSAAQLRATELTSVQKQYDQLIEDWPVLARAFLHARQWQHLYEAETEADARAIWHSWVKSIPIEMQPEMQPFTTRITRQWLTELCAAVRFRDSSGTVANNGITEAINKRARRIDLLTNTGFEMARGRFLLIPSREVRQQMSKAKKQRIEAKMRAASE